MDKDDLEKKVTTDSVKDTDNDNKGEQSAWENAAGAAYLPQPVKPGDNGPITPAQRAEQRHENGDRSTLRDLIEGITVDKKDVLLTKTARDIAKYAALDGKLSDEEKTKMKEAFQDAFDMGCEKELVKSINEKLKAAGSKNRVFMDSRQNDDDGNRLRGIFFQDRQLVVINTDSGEVTDSTKFRVVDHAMMRPDPIRIDPPIRPWPRELPILPDPIEPRPWPREEPRLPIDRLPDWDRIVPPQPQRPPRDSEFPEKDMLPSSVRKALENLLNKKN